MARFVLSLPALVIFLLPAVTEAAALAPRASGTSTCFVCPPTDNLGFQLGDSNTASNPIFCSYPAVAGEDPNDFFCKYDAVTGILTTDNDAGLCPAIAPTAQCTNKRDDNFKAMKRRAEARAAQPRASGPDAMTKKSAFGKKRGNEV